MAEQITCKGDCITCNAAQRIYCSAQRTFAIMQGQQVILEQLAELREAISQAKAVAPLDETGTDDAGADTRASEKSLKSKSKKL